MLSAQLVGRLLPEIENSDNIRNLLRNTAHTKPSTMGTKNKLLDKTINKRELTIKY